MPNISRKKSQRDDAARRPSETRSRARARAARAATAPPSGALRILCVHGVGHQEADPRFEASWREAIARGIGQWSPVGSFEIEFVAYDDLFEADPPDAGDVAAAVFKMTASGIVHGIADLFRRRRGFGDLAESLRWTAGMVVQWAENDELRAKARQRVLKHTENFDPHVILAHSLGSLLGYDAFRRPEGHAHITGKTFVSFGSQIGNPFVRSTLGGRIEPLETCRQWFHLFNPHDDAFTARLRITHDRFEQVDAQFDIDGMLDHDAGEYLLHPNTTNIVWRDVAASDAGRRPARGVSASFAMLSRQSEHARPASIAKPRRRALLVGINDYPNAADRLEGCVNDVFLMSSLLQEVGFAADDIRIVLNERATTKGILDRLDWLLDGAQDGQERVFYYSGHGAQIPGYGVGEKVDAKDECLVAYDFDWSRDRAVTDDQFYERYSQLPYDTQFLTIFDCCHSGGMTRDGGVRVRGLTPPDDIRHRELRWSQREEMWVSRDFEPIDKDAASVMVRSKRAGAERGAAELERQQTRFGRDGSVRKLGVGSRLRARDSEFEAARQAYGHKGPFMPVILQACRETQFSYEYRHGVQSYGAFTYSLGLILRKARKEKRKLTWLQLRQALADKLKKLDYDQTPALVCPTSIRSKPIPWKLN